VKRKWSRGRVWTPFDVAKGAGIVDVRELATRKAWVELLAEGGLKEE